MIMQVLLYQWQIVQYVIMNNIANITDSQQEAHLDAHSV